MRKPRRQDSDCSDVPELSTSVESAASEYGVSGESRSDAVNIRVARPCLVRADSSERYRGKEKHMTPVHLVRLMEDLDKSKSSAEDWISRRSFIAPEVATKVVPDQSAPSTSSASPASSAIQVSPAGSESSKSSEEGSHSVVRGFSPGQVSSSYRSKTKMAPEPSEAKPVAAAKKTQNKMWIIGSPSDDETDCGQSYNSRQGPHVSELAEGLKVSGKKRASFRDEVATRTVYDDAFTDDDEDVSESAIEDDCSDWESSTDSAHSSFVDTPMFQRVESRPQLTSRRSLLSTMLHEPNLIPTLAGPASRSMPALRSRSSSPSGPSPASSPRKDLSYATKMDVCLPKPIAMAPGVFFPSALSPRTTRRTMLASELTESLRKQMLWERKQKNTTASAVLKRRHTAHDVTKLSDYPHPTFMKENTSKNNSWNHGYETDYHGAGW